MLKSSRFSSCVSALEPRWGSVSPPSRGALRTARPAIGDAKSFRCVAVRGSTDLQRRCLARRADAESTEGVTVQTGILVWRAVVAVAIAVFLIDREFQAHATWKPLNRFAAFENGAMLAV